MPQDQQERFRTEVFERYQRIEKSVVAAMMEIGINPEGRRCVLGVGAASSRTSAIAYHSSP